MIETKRGILKLIKEAEAQFAGTGKALLEIEDYVAEYLTANGVLIPPCKIGDDIWWVNAEEKLVECQKNGIAGVLWNGKEWRICDTNGDIDPIGTQWSCLTKEDAEKILEEIKKGVRQ